MKKEIDLEKISRIIKEISRNIVIVSLEKGLLEKAFEYSRELDISYYDSIYVSLSEKYDSPLITADKKLIEACTGTRHKVLPLSKFGE